MKPLGSLLASPYFLGFALLYAVCLALSAWLSLFPLEEAVVVLLLMGLAFPGIAYLATRGATPMPTRRERSVAQAVALAGCVLLMVAYLGFGKTSLDGLAARALGEGSLLQALASAAGKLVVAVAIPFWVFRRFFGFRWRDFGLRPNPRGAAWLGHRRPLAVMALLWLVFQVFLGSAARPIREGAFSALELAVGLPLAFLWLVVEVGWVEEFFFRALLQNQLAGWLRSELGGVFVSAAIFGLAHAPGLYLRGAGSVTALGDAPSLLGALTWSVAILAVAGLSMGTLWARTRNLALVMLVHAAGDLLPSYPELMALLGRHAG